MSLNRIPQCHEYGAALSGARLFIDYQWWCSDCAYVREYGSTGQVKRLEPRPRVDRLHPQEERLFSLPPAHQRGGER